MFSAHIERQRILVFSAETNTAAEAVFRQVRIGNVGTIVGGDGAVFKHKDITLAAFGVCKFAINGIGIQTGLVVGLILQVQVHADALPGQRILTLIHFQQ